MSYVTQPHVRVAIEKVRAESDYMNALANCIYDKKRDDKVRDLAFTTLDIVEARIGRLLSWVPDDKLTEVYKAISLIA